MRSHGVGASGDLAFARTRLTDETLWPSAAACRGQRGAKPPAARHGPHWPARSCTRQTRGPAWRAEGNIVWCVPCARYSLCAFRCVGLVPSAMGSLFEIHIATHASLQYAEHVRQASAANERTPKSGFLPRFRPQAIAHARSATAGRASACLRLHGSAWRRIDRSIWRAGAQLARAE